MAGVGVVIDYARDADLLEVRALFSEYVRSVDAPECFVGFERELAGLPGPYAPPAGCLLLARRGDEAAGCVGLRGLEPGTAEIKRLYVRPAYRGTGTGRRLAEAAIAAARAAGCRRVVLDTLPFMRDAAALYRALGFRETAPYLAEPTPGSLCFALSLQRRESG